jgi:hypothetical protein
MGVEETPFYIQKDEEGSFPNSQYDGCVREFELAVQN